LFLSCNIDGPSRRPFVARIGRDSPAVTVEKSGAEVTMTKKRQTCTWMLLGAASILLSNCAQPQLKNAEHPGYG